MSNTSAGDKYRLVVDLSCEQPKHSNPDIFDKGHLTCDYCGKSRNPRDCCRKLNGRPTQGHGSRLWQHHKKTCMRLQKHITWGSIKCWEFF